MSYLFRRFSLAALPAAVLAASAQPGYLPLVGPAPLRFEQPLASSSNPPVALPPLAFLEPRPPIAPAATNPAAATMASAEATNAIPVLPELPVALVPPLDPGSTNVVGTNGETPQPEAGLLVPQMFMKYFTSRPGTNGSSISVFAPVGFVPPVPLLPPSSSATFETTPPGKP